MDTVFRKFTTSSFFGQSGKKLYTLLCFWLCDGLLNFLANLSQHALIY